MSKRKHNWTKTHPSGGANPPPQNVAEVFGGTLAGGVPISASVLHLEPMRFQVSGVTDAEATRELIGQVRDEFTRRGVLQHPVSVEMEIGGTKITRKLLVIFDESYTYSAMWPLDIDGASAGMPRQVEEPAPDNEAQPHGCPDTMKKIIANQTEQMRDSSSDEFVLIDITLPEGASKEDNIVKIANLLVHSRRQDTIIAGKDDNHFRVRFRSLSIPAVVKALLAGFPQFHLMWIDRILMDPTVNIPVAGRFGEAWTTEYAPLWFVNEEDGDRYYEGDTILVWNRMGHEYLTGDTLFKAGAPASEYKYGMPGADGELQPEVTKEEINAALALAGQPGKYVSTVIPERGEQELPKKRVTNEPKPIMELIFKNRPTGPRRDREHGTDETMVERFGGDPASGRIPIPSGVMQTEPIPFVVSGDAEADAQTRLLTAISGEFKRRDIHQHRIVAEVKVGERRLDCSGEYVVLFDEGYTSCTMVPTADVVPRAPKGLCDPVFSPLRVVYHEDDPAKNRTLPLVTAAQKHSRQGDDATIKVRTTWIDAYKLLAGAIRAGIHAWPDPATGDVRVSGYALIGAGCLTEDGKVNVTLTDDERLAGHLSDPPTTEEAINAVMSLYLHNLKIFVEDHPNLAALYVELCEAWPEPSAEEVAEFERAERIRLRK